MKSEVALRKMENVTLTVTITREFRLRIWLALLFIRLAGKILGANVEVKEN
mgnify:CR=1 FL=1